MRAFILIATVLTIAATAQAQEEEDPFAAEDDPFGEDPFAALEANASAAEAELSEVVEDTAAASPTPEPTPEPAAATPAPSPSAPPVASPAKTDDAGSDTPGLGLVAVLAAVGLAFVLARRHG